MPQCACGAPIQSGSQCRDCRLAEKYEADDPDDLVTDGGRDDEQYYVVDETKPAVVAGPFDERDRASAAALEHGPNHVVATGGALDRFREQSRAPLRWETDDERPDLVTDGGHAQPSRYPHDEPCDWTPVGTGAACGATPTAHVGDIYYACEDHFEQFRAWLEDGDETATDAFLAEARSIVGQRDDTHGDVRENHEQIAALWSDYLGVEIAPHEVAELMVLVKLSRIQSGSPDRDHFVDIAGYAAIAGHLALGGGDELRTDGGEDIEDEDLTADHGIPPIRDSNGAVETIAGPDPAAFERERGDGGEQ